MNTINDDIVLSGISGRFPSSDNVREFEQNLYNKVDMTDEDESRWTHADENVPKRFGKVHNLEKFDASFFSTLDKHANWSDPQVRAILEHAYESILDAGISPQSLVGSNTGVFIGNSTSDARVAFANRIPPKDGYLVLGNSTFNIANRVSYALGLCGPSLVLDTACSSSCYALDCAYRYMEAGLCDSAIVGGTQVILDTKLAQEYSVLGIVAPDGVCRPFDEKASGFSRAETISAVFLQRRKDCKRAYAHFVYSSCNNDGYKKEGSTFPSKLKQQELMENFYKHIKLDPFNVNFIEAHATGTKLGDPEEVSAIDEVFCKNKSRSQELVIGSVKSNMGHAEAASGMASLAKILISLENQKFPPNININCLRTDIPAFSERRIKVAIDAAKLQNDFIALNSFGLGGSNAHSLFRGNFKEKVNFGIPDDNQGRMVLWSGRTEAAVNAIFDDITQRSLDAEYIALLQNSQIQTSTANTYRGYGMFIHNEADGKAVCVKKHIEHFNGSRQPIVFVYSGIGSQWIEMGRDLMQIPIFAASIDRSHKVLMNKGIDLKGILMSADENTFSNVMNSYVGIIAIEIAFTDILRQLNIVPDFIIGHSLGEIGCAYADDCFTAEEAILVAHARGQASFESITIRGAMAAVGLDHLKLSEILPKNIDIACHNGNESSTVSGPIEEVNNFMEQLKRNQIFVKSVASSGMPLHSRYIKEMGRILNEKLTSIISDPKRRSPKWLSSTFPESEWNLHKAMFSSAEYHTSNLLNPVLFQEVCKMIPEESLMIEVAPSGLLKAILTRNLKEGTYINLTQRNSEEGTDFFMTALGKLFQKGVDMDISKLYPPVSFPVSRGTPIISSVIKWNHDTDHFVPHYDSYHVYERRNIIINISDKKYEFIQEHMIDGRCLFPATGWIFLVWETFAMMCGFNYQKYKVVLEDIALLRATSFSMNQDVLVTISIHRGTGRFEIIEGQLTIMNGFIKHVDDIQMSEDNSIDIENAHVIDSDAFYSNFRLKGYYHTGIFKGVKEMRLDGGRGKVIWRNNWIAFLDSLTHFDHVLTRFENLGLPVSFGKIIIDPVLHYKAVSEKYDEIKIKNVKEPEILLDVCMLRYKHVIKCHGVEYHGKCKTTVNKRRPQSPLLEIQKFVPFISKEKYKLNDVAKIIVQTVMEQNLQSKFECIEIDVAKVQPFCEHISRALSKTLQVIPTVTYVSTREDLLLKNVTVSNKEISSFNGIDVVIKGNCIKDTEFMKSIKAVINDQGYIISIENKEILSIPQELKLIAKIQSVDNEVFYMLQFRDQVKAFDPKSIIEITPNVKEWLEPLKAALKEGLTVIYSYNKEPSGIIGFVNCIRREYPAERIKCFFIIDTDHAPSVFDLNHPFFKAQLEMNHAINIFEDGKWGSYRHLDMKMSIERHSQSKHCFVNCLTTGDLSTLTWLSGPLDINDSNNDIVNIQYASMNFKDIMLALGKIQLEDNFDQINKLSLLGFEFSGTKMNGERVMGIDRKAGAIATHYDAKDAILWPVPETWTLEEAATVPLVYFTVYFAFFITTTIKRGKKILIHSGSGGVGQAAIEVALAYGLEVFTTVSTEEKKNFLLTKFPQLKPQNIGDSRSTSFEMMVLENTQGKGVDYVLNSLSDEKLEASIDCLGRDGVLLEIGRYDILKNTKLGMKYMMKRITLRAVNFDDFVDYEEELFVKNLMNTDIKSGIIKPLKATIFDTHQVEDAFRFMANGKHIGKVLIRIRQNDYDKSSLPLMALNRVYCNKNESVLIVGGLGGIGQELASWLVYRGCRNLILSSSRGVTNSTQKTTLEFFKIFGVNFEVSTSDITTEKGCEELIMQAAKLGPVSSIFNLAAVLRDGIFENLNEKMFNESLAPKALATKYLDRVSRRLCPNLKHFVTFSSLSCGRGNAGQSNYGLSNSIMERIIEERHRDGLPAKAIQWGPIGDVGMLGEVQMKNKVKNVGGALLQSISSLLETLDVLITDEAPIVSSVVVGDKKKEDFKKGNLIDAILSIIGIRDKMSVSMDSTLSHLGIDSLMAVEIQQVLERDFNISLASQELRNLKLGQLEKGIVSKNSKNQNAEQEEWIKIMLDSIDESDIINFHTMEKIVKANDIASKDDTKVLIVPGFYGLVSAHYRSIASNMQYPAAILNFSKRCEYDNFDEFVECFAPDILKFFDNTKKFILIGHSFGALWTLKIAKILENQGMFGEIIQIDGSPPFIIKMSRILTAIQDVRSSISMVLFKIYKEFADPDVAKLAFDKSKDWTMRLETLIDSSNFPYNFDFLLKNLIISYEKRMEIFNFIKEDDFSKLQNANISLIKAKITNIKDINDDDYGLSRYSSTPLKIFSLDGDHNSILTNPELIVTINNFILNNSSTQVKIIGN